MRTSSHRRGPTFAPPAAWLVSLALLGGCERAAPVASDRRVPAAPLVDTSTPEATVASALRLMEFGAAAAAAGDAASVQDADVRLRAIVDEPEVLRGLGRRSALLGEDPIQRIVRLWRASVAYYAGGIDVDSVRRIRGDQRREYGAWGRRGDAVALILVTVMAHREGSWRVIAVTLGDSAEERAFAGLTSRPASRPHP